MNYGHPVSDIITVVSGVITIATVQQMRTWSTLNKALVSSLSLWSSENLLILTLHSDGRFSNLYSISTDQTSWTYLSKKELAFEYLNMFLYVSLCICLSLYIHAHKEKKLTKNTYPKFSCKKLNVHQEKVTSGAQGQKKTLWKKLLQWEEVCFLLETLLMEFSAWTEAF